MDERTAVDDVVRPNDFTLLRNPADPTDEILLPPRSPVFCPSLSKLLGTLGTDTTGGLGFLWHGATKPEDPDSDGHRTVSDRCQQVHDVAQRDSDGDGFGNACDADLNGDGLTDFVDLGFFKAAFFSDDPDADLNGDGIVDFVDLGLFKRLFFQPPGP